MCQILYQSRLDILNSSRNKEGCNYLVGSRIAQILSYYYIASLALPAGRQGKNHIVILLLWW